MTGADGPLLRYRVMAYVVGVMLLVVFSCIPFGRLEQVIGPIHGALYILYLGTALQLGRREGLRFWTLAGMVVAGWVPFVAFVAERRVSAMVGGAQSRRGGPGEPGTPTGAGGLEPPGAGRNQS